jgi:hypothetical protein
VPDAGRRIGTDPPRAVGLGLLLMLAGCAERPAPDLRAASRYLLVQAAGVEFGVTQAELEALRPNATWTTSGLVDRITSRDANAFVFGPFPPAGRVEPCPTCRLSAVTMTSALPAGDTAAYSARVRAIRTRWTVLAGPPRDSTADTIRTARWRTVRWRAERDSVALLLRYRTDATADSSVDSAVGARLVHATVYDERVVAAGNR